MSKDLNVRDTEKIIRKMKDHPAPAVKKDSKDRYIADLERSLSTKCQARVQIKGTAQKGAIEISYQSLDELNRLTRYILDEL